MIAREAFRRAILIGLVPWAIALALVGVVIAGAAGFGLDLGRVVVCR